MINQPDDRRVGNPEPQRLLSAMPSWRHKGCSGLVSGGHKAAPGYCGRGAAPIGWLGLTSCASHRHSLHTSQQTANARGSARPAGPHRGRCTWAAAGAAMEAHAPPPPWHALAAGGTSAIVSRLFTCACCSDSPAANTLHDRVPHASQPSIPALPSQLEAPLRAAAGSASRRHLLTASSCLRLLLLLLPPQTLQTRSRRGCRCRAPAARRSCTAARLTPLPRSRRGRWGKCSGRQAAASCALGAPAGSTPGPRSAGPVLVHAL